MVELRDKNNQSWQEVAANLRKGQFDQALISPFVSIPEVITGFVLSQAGVIPQDRLFNPLVWTASKSVQTSGADLPIFDPKVQNPTVLKELITPCDQQRNEKGKPLYNLRQRQLMKLINHLDHYRSFPSGNWWRAREGMQNYATMASLYLHDFLTSIILANSEDSTTAFKKCYEALVRSLELGRHDFYHLAPKELVDVPVLKSKGNDPDITDVGRFKFDRMRAVFLPGKYYRIVVGGAPNSGKSTFSFSECQVLEQLIRECEQDGIIAPGEVSVGLCDLDLCSPTSSMIKEGRLHFQREKRVWDANLVEEALMNLEEAQQKYNILICDLPGGLPDSVTSALTQGARFSIIINQAYNEVAGEWGKFFRNWPSHNNLMVAHTRFGEESRVSAIRNYESVFEGRQNEDVKRNFLWGRMVNLNRNLVADDPFVKFAAHCLLFDFLPGETILQIEKRSALFHSVGALHSKGYKI